MKGLKPVSDSSILLGSLEGGGNSPVGNFKSSVAYCVNFWIRVLSHCLPRGRHSEAAHEKRLLCAQKCTRGGVGGS